MRVFGRLLLKGPEGASGRNGVVRGWRSFATLPVTDEAVILEVGGRQHDPEIYGDFAESHPDNVAAVAIRQLSPDR